MNCLSNVLLQGAAAGPLHPRAGALPLDPKWKLAPVWCLTRMPLVYSDSHIAREHTVIALTLVLTHLPEGF